MPHYRDRRVTPVKPGDDGRRVHIAIQSVSAGSYLESAVPHCGKLTCLPSVERANFFTLAGLPR
jgi:hypothetical protein